MQAGNHPPLGVIDTTHPEVSAASTDVVPRHNLSMYAESNSTPVIAFSNTILLLRLYGLLSIVVFLSWTGIAFPPRVFVLSTKSSLCFNNAVKGLVFPSKV